MATSRSAIDPRVNLLKLRRTKIVATMGPASESPAVARALVEAGVDVFRLNMSHGEHAEHRRRYETVRAVAADLGRHIAVLADLCGPKIRVGKLEGGVMELASGQELIVTTRDVLGRSGVVPSRYKALAQDVSPGNRILLDDGNLELSVLGVIGEDVRCRIVRGGILKDGKGINLPGVAVSAPSLTPKDREDAAFALALGVDFLALSFVRSAADVELLRALEHEVGVVRPIVAKIEKPEALAVIDEILAASDAVMVARGDLGVELPAEQVPVVQEQLVDRARAFRRPVIVATQMLESMIENATPTRAEVSDVANAVKSGADAIMLSAETAAGLHPLAAVRVMDRVARQTEGYLWHQGTFGSITHDDTAVPPLDLGIAIARSTALLSRDLLVRSIVVVSRTGTSTGEVCASRPAAPVVVLASSAETCRRMALFWGAVPVLVPPEAIEPAGIDACARQAVRDLELAEPGERILVVRGFNPDPAYSSPSVTVLPV